jgi:DNA-binding winged helix-turn-helix (wHTH) protein
MIEDYCRSQKIEGSVLAIPYKGFRAVLRAAGGDPGRVTQPTHIHEILRQGVLALLGHLRHRSQLAQQLYKNGQPRWVGLIPPTYLTPVFVNRLLRQIGGLSIGLTAAKLQGMVCEQAWDDLPTMARGEARLTVQVLALLLSGMATSGADPSPSPVEQLKEFIDLLRFLGFDAGYILVDRLDELPETAESPQTGVALLRPLLDDLALLELPHLAFKFFLPTEMQPAVEAVTRADRITFRHVVWSDNDLQRLLEARLRAFSDDRISSLSQVSDVGLKDIDDRLIGQAAGSPRNLIRLGEFVFSEHCRLPVDERVEIDAQDWDRALRRYRSELGLNMDSVTGRVIVAGRELPADALTPREYEVLQFLYEHAGRLCTKDEIAYGIYGTEEGAEVSTGAIEQAVNRLRKKIEPGDEALFIITIPSKGYRLDHARPTYSSREEEES